MAGQLLVRRSFESHETFEFRMLSGPLERLRGLLGTDASAEPVALLNCRSIHTFGMRYRIDVAFVAADGTVLESWSSVPPGRVLSNRHAWVTLERPHARSAWVAKGEHVLMER